jgi:ComF family protein
MADGNQSTLGFIRHGAAAVTDLLFPPCCVNCGAEGEFSPEAALLCAECNEALSQESLQRCSRCALLCSDVDLAKGDCVSCRDRQLGFREARALGAYEKQLRGAVLKSKHSAGEALARALGQLLAEKIERSPFSSAPALVAAVPMHWLKRMWRGANGAQTVAAAVARKLELPLAPRLLICRRYMRRQATLTPPERRRNVRGAFRAGRRWSRRLRGQTILLVDDVMTTGATAEEAAKVLLAAGAATVCVATVARSSPQALREA